MRRVLFGLWADDGGAVIAMEWVFVATILALGAVTGLVAVRQAVLAELSDLASAVVSFHRSPTLPKQGNAEAPAADSPLKDGLDPAPATSVPPRRPADYELRACD